MRVLVTGADGFIGKNLVLRLREGSQEDVIAFVRSDSDASLLSAARTADAVVHLAGENRPLSPAAFEAVNVGLTRRICDILRSCGIRVPLILASSSQAGLDNPYGRSKLAAEEIVAKLAHENSNPVAIFRLPGVFGKWCKPDYNSVVATFCHNVANDLPIQVHDPEKVVSLAYVDDVVSAFLDFLRDRSSGVSRPIVNPTYQVSLGALARQIQAFDNCRTSLISEPVGVGLTRALYGTYLSYFPKEKFVYSLPAHRDKRGIFVEMLKTLDTGQFSYFTAYPGETRGGHYHHTKSEKFLVIKGEARFSFRHLMTHEFFSIQTSGDSPQVVETVPGWTHHVTNVGPDELIVMLWANEIFDRDRPDTISCKV